MVCINLGGATMDNNEKVTLAARLLALSVDEVKEHSEVIEKNGALYVSVPTKGGDSLIIDNDGTVLYADSSVGYSRHLKEFESGNRTPLDAFEQ